jgi:hypothetical protein
MLVVKANRIVANRNRVGRKEFFERHFRKFSLSVAFFNRFLRADFRHHQRIWTRQNIIVQANQNIHRLADFIQIHICSLTSKLHNSILARIKTAGFEIIKKEGFHSYILLDF